MNLAPHAPPLPLIKVYSDTKLFNNIATDTSNFKLYDVSIFKNISVTHLEHVPQTGPK